MNAREFLDQYRQADNKAQALRKEYEKELELIDNIRSSSDIDGLPKAKRISRAVEDNAVRLADKAAEWKIAELDALHYRQEIFETIIKVGGDASAVLIERYVNLKQWSEVCVAVHWSWYKVQGLHKTGLAKVEEIIK